MDELELDLLKASVFGEDDISPILDQLAASGNPRAQQIRERVVGRQRILSTLNPNNLNIKRSVERQDSLDRARLEANARRDALQSGTQAPVQGVPEFLDPVGRALGQGLNQVATFPSRLLDNATQVIGEADQALGDFIDPQAALNQLIVDENNAQINDLDFSSSINPSSGLDQFPAPQGTTPVPATVPNYTLPQSVGNPFDADLLAQARQQAAQAEQYNQLVNAQAALQVGAAQQQGANLANRENLQRLSQQISLQQVPQVANTLGAAAQLGQTPQIGGAPANVLQTLPLTQSVAPQVNIPSLAPAARTNISQRNSLDRKQESADNATRRQQLKALELAMQQFRNNIAAPILTRPR